MNDPTRLAVMIAFGLLAFVGGFFGVGRPRTGDRIMGTRSGFELAMIGCAAVGTIGMVLTWLTSPG
jgi:hypothetical protein